MNTPIRKSKDEISVELFRQMNITRPASKAVSDKTIKTPRSKSKYKNTKVITAVGTFDSRKEFNRYLVLKQMEAAQEISCMERQKKYEIKYNGIKICTYKADFDYWQNGKHIVEDVKGYKTAIYQLKKKMVKAFFGVEILET